MRPVYLRVAGFLYLAVTVSSLTYVVAAGVYGLDNWQLYLLVFLSSLVLAPMTVLFDVWTRSDLRESAQWEITHKLMFDVSAVVPAFNYLLAGDDDR